MYGIPHEVVRRKIFGACFFNASPYRTRVPDSNAWLEEDHADVMTMALTSEGMPLIPASLAAITKGDWVAVPDQLLSRLSVLGTSIPTTKTAKM